MASSTLPSSPSIIFRDSLDEVARLMSIHEQLTGTGPGKRHDVEVLNKSAVILACAAFEAYVENMASAAFDHIVAKTADPMQLPKTILKSIAKSLKEDKHELRVWDLAGVGWQSQVAAFKRSIFDEHVQRFNTPKPDQIKNLFSLLIGFSDLPGAWRWHGMNETRARTKLEAFVTLRGDLAHGRKPAPTVRKQDVTGAIAFLGPLSVRSANAVRDYCHRLTGEFPWRRVQHGNIR